LKEKLDYIVTIWVDLLEKNTIPFLISNNNQEIFFILKGLSYISLLETALLSARTQVVRLRVKGLGSKREKLYRLAEQRFCLNTH
jgi:hypothetical protein